MDGQFHAIEFDPSATAEEVLKLVKSKIGLRENAQGENNFHFYVLLFANVLIIRGFAGTLMLAYFKKGLTFQVTQYTKF